MLSGSQGISLIKLYEMEIERALECIYVDADKGEMLDELLPLGRIKKLRDEQHNRTDFAKKLLNELYNSPMSYQLYTVILNFLVNLGEEYKLLHSLLLRTLTYFSKQFKIILDNLDGFIIHTDPYDVIHYIDKIEGQCQVTRLLRKEIETVDDTFAKKLILRNIPHRDIDGEKFIEDLHPGFGRFYNKLLNNKDTLTGKFAVCPSNESIKDFMLLLGTPEMEKSTRYKIVDLRTHCLPMANEMENMIVKSLESRVSRENNIVLRNYQAELCEHAVQGKNTVITAPTGSGKTIIAAHLIKNHFSVRRNAGMRCKGLFLTPNTVLLEQQAKMFRRYLGHLNNVTVIQGSSSTSTRYSLYSSDLVVATPQIIVNFCKENYSNEDRPQFFLSIFTMIIFDECHAAQKNSPYSVIMKTYHTLKRTRRMPSDHTIPQIIGLTASLGVGNAKDIDQAISHICDICANLDIEEISTVQKHKDSLLRFSPVIPDSCIVCPKSKDPLLFQYSTVLSEFMKVLESSLMSILENCDILAKPIVNNKTERKSAISHPPNDKTFLGYNTWIGNMKREISESRLKEVQQNKKVFGILEILEHCHLSHTNNWNFNSNVAWNNLSNYMRSQMSSMDTDILETWNEYQLRLKRYVTNDNSMLSQIEDVIWRQYKENTDFRGIIFVKTQQGAMILSNLLNNSPRLKGINIRTDYITGVNAAKETGSSTSKNIVKLERFTTGEIRILIATSVAEEGLDIAKCNVVIKYNHTSNEIAHVQRRGRGRAANSHCILITNCEELMEKEEKNRHKEELMENALKFIVNHPKWFKEVVIKKRNNIWNKIREGEVIPSENIAPKSNSEKVYKILCKKCHGYLCESTDIRIDDGNKYYICSSKIWNTLSLRKQFSNESSSSKVLEMTDLCLSEKIYCNNCEFCLGILNTYKNVNLPRVDVRAIVIAWKCGNEVEVKSMKKWKEVTDKYFVPSQLRSFDIVNLLSGN